MESESRHNKITNFKHIRDYFDKLNFDKNHFVNSNDICTPMDCVKEMVDSIPDNFWQKDNLKILDSCCGNGNFHGYIRTKTNLKNLYFNEINPKRIENVKEYFGSKINLTCQDFLTYPTSCDDLLTNTDKNIKKYDLIVSNPPYAKFNDNGRVSKNHNLSRDFIKKALDLTYDGGYILFIVPNNWMSYSDRNTLPKKLSQYQFIHLDIGGAKKYFPKVGSSFSWFLLQKSPNRHKFTINNHYKIKDTQQARLNKNVNFIPLYYSDMVREILDLTINNKKLPKYEIQTTSDLHRTTKKQFISEHKTAEYKYKLIHTPTKTLWSKQAHKFQDGFKVFLSLTNQYGLFIDNCGMTQSVAFIRCKTQIQAIKTKQELEQDVYKFINNITRYGNFNNVRVLQNYPLWGSFKLNSAQNSFIKKFNTKYYGKKEK